jgi:hypothetical protein
LNNDDGFRAPDDESDAPFVVWDGEESHNQNVYHLHGALHLYDHGPDLRKICWERAGGVPLIDQVMNALNEGSFPLFVSEGSSLSKVERIRHSGYLHHGLRSFRAICDVQKNVLFIFGHSLHENDDHILEQIEKGRIGTTT